MEASFLGFPIFSMHDFFLTCIEKIGESEDEAIAICIEEYTKICYVSVCMHVYGLNPCNAT